MSILIEQKDKVLLEKARLLSEAEVNVNKSKNSLDSLVSKRDYLTSEIQKTKTKLAEQESNISAKTKALEKANTDNPILRENHSKLIKNLEKLNVEYRDVCSQLAEKRQILDILHSNESSVKNRSRIISELTKQKESGEIPGIYGRLGDLATVDPKYDCAISSASSYLDHCLVDNMDTAIKCVDFLRKNNLGIASFIALDKMNVHKSSMKNPFKAPAGSLRLFDLISVSEAEFQPAFYFALRDTLVSENIDEATRIAFGTKTRYRVATLKGDIVEKNGTITSGGQPITGKMRLTKDIPSHVDKSIAKLNQSDLKKMIDKLEDQKMELTDDISKTEEEIRSVSATMKEIDIVLSKTDKEIEIHRQECKTLTGLREKLQAEYKICLPDQNELHKAQMNYEQQKKEKDKAQSNYDVIEEQIRKINQQISIVKGGILDSHQTELTSKKRLLDDINSELNKASASVTSNQRQLQKSEQSIKEYEANLNKILKKIENFEQKKQNLEDEMTKEKEALQKLENENADSCEKLKHLKEDIQKLDSDHETNRKRMLEIKLQIDSISSKVHNYESKAKHIQGEMDQLVHRSFDETGKETVEPIKPPSPDELQGYQRQKIHDQIKEVQDHLDSLKPDLGAIDQYYKKV
ncbi:Structural maintenance of chromosomes protein 4 [Thelohanellus kitauei]|uniref:Structural maintenance of chromosomes protein 4 n=1 Tax=Thelohanellus kitauei TaxID=669202 RepID=A0A0C2MNL3_THEKT|nr:Structural maintenance of chromosomes protein 4 [Thelohanellus kitauei]